MDIGSVHIAMITVAIFMCGCSGADNKNVSKSGDVSVDTIVHDRTFVADETTGNIIEKRITFHFVGTTENDMLVKGIATYENGDVYTGGFANVAREDTMATLRLHNGDKYKGSFYNNMYKEGTYTLSSGEYFSGTFRNNQPYEGAWYDSDGKVSFNVINGKY